MYAQNQKNSQHQVRVLGVIQDWFLVGKNISIHGDGLVVYEKKYTRATSQKLLLIRHVVVSYSRNNMPLSALYIVIASGIWGIDGYVRQ